MSLRPSRLGVAEALIGVGSAGLLVVLFAVRWYEVSPRFRDSLLELGERVSANGWQTFMWIGPLCLVVAVLGVLAVWLQLTRASPALPVVAVTLLSPLSILLVVALVVRVLIARPSLHLAGVAGGALQVSAGAYAGLGLAIVIAAGAWLSLRREGVAPADAPAVVAVVCLRD